MGVIMRYGQIRQYDIANGEGIRTSIFVTGCSHCCYNCFNEEYQDFHGKNTTMFTCIRFASNQATCFINADITKGNRRIATSQEWSDFFTFFKSRNYKFDGRFNMGVVSLNLPQIGILARGSEEKYFEILDKRLELAEKALMLRYNLLKDVVSDVSPIHWQHGAIARLKKGEKIVA